MTTTDITPSPAGGTGATPLTAGINHVALVTGDADRLAGFYVDVFDGELIETPAPPGTRAITVRLAGTAGLAIMEVPGHVDAHGSSEMLARGHIDHLAIDAPSATALEAVRRRLVERGASDGRVNDYEPMLSVYFVDPDGMGCECCWVRDPTFAGAHAPEPFTGRLADL